MNAQGGKTDEKERAPAPEPEFELHPLIILFQSGMADMKIALAGLKKSLSEIRRGQ